MPRFDGTGPQGLGPLTGRGMGPCGLGFRKGFRMGRGLGRQFWNWPDSKEAQKQTLQDYKNALEEELSDVEKELENLSK